MIALPRPLRQALTLLLVPLAVAALVLPAQAQIKFREITSPKGITAWMVEDYTVPIITLAFAFEGGAAQDPDDQLGRANLMSSLLDEGAGDLGSEAFQIRLDEVGLELGFSADQDTFSGSARMLADQRGEAAPLLALAVNAPRFDQPAVDRMRAQIMAGLVARSEDPGYAARLMWNKALFGDHPYGRPEEGTLETLPNISLQDLKAYHHAVFARDTLKVGIVGAISPDAAGALIDQVFGGLAETPELKPVLQAELSFGQELAVDYPLPQTSINMAFPGVAEDHPDFFPARVLTELVAGRGLLSTLNVEVREKRGLSYGVSGSMVNLEHAEAITIGTSTSPAQADEAVEVIRATLSGVAENGPQQDELERIKRYLIGAFPINQLRSSISIARAMVGQQLRDLPIDYIEERTERIEAVSAAEVQAVAQEIFTAEPSLMLVGPDPDPEQE
ncbi:M16 family metallopeptidase [Devosia sp. RR2S18]|uniref:M16 family metallopeptidase n=1 Tax=Devosia rhizosphaerae TaxID=3049774 RepID=UPI00253FEAF8|nr:pitrilysin family protein [Devosia sp. RR2S18]WIJ24053.1 pitrilysin family protein [Devosia sp. RR2S18]